MNVLVTGAGGMLGQEMCLALTEKGVSFTATSRKDGLTPLDVTDTARCADVIGQLRPDAIIHCAAWTDVDGAERDPLGAYKGNALGAWNIAAAAANVGAWMVYVSTDFVFDGEKGTPYTEFDATNPLNVYGASKEAGERLVRDTLPDRHMIARTSWLFGKRGQCFPKTVLRLAGTKTEIPIVADQIGAPTYAPDLARKLLELFAAPLPGTYHISNAGHCSWFEFAEAIVRRAGLPARIIPITAAEYAVRFHSPTRRPAYSVMRPLALEMRGRNDLRPWEEALAEYMVDFS